MIALLVGVALAAKAVVLADDVGACEVIGAERLTSVKWPTALGAPPVVDPAAVVGKVAMEPLFTGEAVRAERLAADPKAAGCAGGGASQVAVPVASAVYEPGVAVSWWAPRLGCALFSGRVVAGVDAVQTIGLGEAPPPAALAAFATNRTVPVVSPRAAAPLATCAWGPTLPAGPWAMVAAPGARLRGAVGDGPWGQSEAVQVPIGVGGLGGVVTVADSAGVHAWPVGVDEAPADETIVVAPGGVAIVGKHTLVAGVQDRAIVDLRVMPDGHTVVIGLALGETKVIAVSPEGPVVRTLVVSGPAVQARVLSDRWRNLMEGDSPVVLPLSGGPFETQLDHGWVQVRAVAPGRALVVFFNRAGQAQVMLVNRAS